jgi:hypothetical protein
LFIIAAGPRQRSHSQVQVQRDSRPCFTVSDSRLPQPGVPAPRIYIPQEQGSPVISPGTGLHFRRFLRLAGLRWRYSNTPPRGVESCLYAALLHVILHLRIELGRSYVAFRFSNQRPSCSTLCILQLTSSVTSEIYTALRTLSLYENCVFIFHFLCTCRLLLNST